MGRQGWPLPDGAHRHDWRPAGRRLDGGSSSRSPDVHGLRRVSSCPCRSNRVKEREAAASCRQRGRSAWREVIRRCAARVGPTRVLDQRQCVSATDACRPGHDQTSIDERRALLVNRRNAAVHVGERHREVDDGPSFHVPSMKPIVVASEQLRQYTPLMVERAPRRSKKSHFNRCEARAPQRLPSTRLETSSRLTRDNSA